MHFESQKLSFGSTTTKTTSLRSQKKDANSKHHTEQNNSLAHTMSATTIAAKPTTFPLRRRKHVAFFAWRRRHDYFPTTLRGPAPPLFSPSRRHINSGGALNASSALTGREPSEAPDRRCHAAFVPHTLSVFALALLPFLWSVGGAGSEDLLAGNGRAPLPLRSPAATQRQTQEAFFFLSRSFSTRWLCVLCFSLLSLFLDIAS